MMPATLVPLLPWYCSEQYEHADFTRRPVCDRGRDTVSTGLCRAQGRLRWPCDVFEITRDAAGLQTDRMQPARAVAEANAGSR